MQIRMYGFLRWEWDKWLKNSPEWDDWGLDSSFRTFFPNPKSPPWRRDHREGSCYSRTTWRQRLSCSLSSPPAQQPKCSQFVGKRHSKSWLAASLERLLEGTIDFRKPSWQQCLNSDTAANSSGSSKTSSISSSLPKRSSAPGCEWHNLHRIPDAGRNFNDEL